MTVTLIAFRVLHVYIYFHIYLQLIINSIERRITMIGKLLQLKSKRVLYIDSGLKDIQIMNLLGILFEKVFLANNDKDAIALYEDESPHLIITNIKSDDRDSLKLIKKLRQYDYHIPIVIVTEEDDPHILIHIANLSIDAYLHKPFNHETFTKAICRSIKRNSDENGLIILSKQLVFNIATKELYLNGSVVGLGAKENQLLLFLIENRFKTISKEEIEKKLWPLDSVSDSAVKKLILRIRQKMKTNIILSVRGIGYRLDTLQTKRTQEWLASA